MYIDTHCHIEDKNDLEIQTMLKEARSAKVSPIILSSSTTLDLDRTLEIAKKLNYDLVLITGNPDYYKKYGFVLSSTYSIYYEGLENEEAPFFMVKVLNEKNITKYEGIYTDPEVFNVTEEEVSDFDKNFPPKEKLVLPGQLN